MHKSVLMHADIDKCAEINTVAHRTLKFHPGPQIVYVHNVATQHGCGQVLARVAAGPGQFRDDVAAGSAARRQANRQPVSGRTVRRGPPDRGTPDGLSPAAS